MTKEKAKEYLSKVVEALIKVSDFSKESVEFTLKSVIEALGIKPGQVLPLVRIAVTGKIATPPLYDSICAMGKDGVIARVKSAINEL